MTSIPAHIEPNTDIRLISAGDFTLDELTAIYNQTRVDYIDPHADEYRAPGGIHQDV